MIWPLALPLVFLIAALGCLAWLTVIDLRTMILPDRLVFLYGLLGVGFHLSTGFTILTPIDLLTGAGVGGGFLATVRWAGNHYYGQESMGLGDVKLLIAGGLWLGGMGAVWAITLGAAITIIFAFAHAEYQRQKTGKFPSLHRLEVPAGPGFCVALALLTLYLSKGLV